MPRYRVFIAYGGSNALIVARDMANCLWQRGIQPVIAAPNCRGSVSLASQEEIFRLERSCDAVLAVNTDESYDSHKFIDEVEKARYSRPTMPLVAFVEEGGRVLESLSVGCTNVNFQREAHKRKCRRVVDELRNEIARSRSARLVREYAVIPRRRIR